MKKSLIVILMVVLSFVAVSSALAATSCTFTALGTTMTLDGDCTTDATILVPDGFTLDGAGHTITAVDPAGGHFTGAVIKNGGAVAHVRNLEVAASGLANVCDAGDNRLRGIMLEGASGSITHNKIMNINQGPSGCQEGNAIEVRNAPFDGTHPSTKSVEVANNKITNYQKTGIVANGDVFVNIHNNQIGASATQANLAANSVQFGFGGGGSLNHNNIDGNQWCGPSDFAATAVLLFLANDGAEVSQNNIRGNADVGIYGLTNNAVINNNKVFDEGSDCNAFGYDVGIGDYSAFTGGSGSNSVTNNKVRDYGTPYEEVNGGKNKVIPGPQDKDAAFN
ncbi:right-handed parallel beta-helix repeat-containing protein [Candidatus Woesearchaeota archaeon]|nr:right-handed parallel beta-helix repeat-containing protein [Candidatus Woesearchaeota archaeon]